MASPLLLYLFNEAASGTTPTVVHDTSTGTAADATITYGASAAWTSTGAGNGFNHSVGGFALTASLGGTKVQTAMAGSKTATVQMVVDANGGGGNIFVLYASNLDEIISIAFDSGNAEMDVTLANGAGDYGVGRFTLPTTGVFVITILIDTTQTGTAVVQGYLGTTALTTRTFTAIPVGTAIDAGESWTLGNGIRLSIGNNPATSQATTKTYFAALYSSVLGTTQINANATALAANNDADPNGAAAAFVAARRMVAQLVEDDPPPARQRRSALIQQAPIISVVPPFRRQRALAQDDDAPPQAPRRFVPQVAAVVASFVPFRRRPPQVDPDPTFVWMGARSAQIQMPSGDPPPVGWPRRLLSLLSWTEPDPPTLPRRFVPIPTAVVVPDNPPLGWPRRILSLLLPQEPDAPVTPRDLVVQGAPLAPSAPPGRMRRLFDAVAAAWDDPPVAPRRSFIVQPGPVPPIPPIPPLPTPTPVAGGIGNQTTGVYDPNIALSFLLSVQDATGAPIATNTFVSTASPFNDYALATAGLLGPVRVASGRDLGTVKGIIGNARRIGASNTPEGSIVQYPHLIGAMGLSFQMVGLMDLSGATYANVESAAQTGGVYRYPPAGYPVLKGLP